MIPIDLEFRLRFIIANARSLDDADERVREALDAKYSFDLLWSDGASISDRRVYVLHEDTLEEDIVYASA